MHRRFDGARAVELRSPGGDIGVVVAEGFRLRLLGLMRLEAREIEPLLFLRCRSIHTHGMRTPIDLVWMETEAGQARILEVVEALAPGGYARAPRGSGRRWGIAALELAPGEARRLRLTPTAEVEIAPHQQGQAPPRLAIAGEGDLNPHPKGSGQLRW